MHINFSSPGTDWAALAQEWIRQRDANPEGAGTPPAPQESNAPPPLPPPADQPVPPLPGGQNRHGDAPPLPPPMNGNDRNEKGRSGLYLTQHS